MQIYPQDDLNTSKIKTWIIFAWAQVSWKRKTAVRLMYNVRQKSRNICYNLCYWRAANPLPRKTMLCEGNKRAMPVEVMHFYIVKGFS